MIPVVEPVCDMVWQRTYREMNKTEDQERDVMEKIHSRVAAGPQEFFNDIQAMIYKEVR